MKQLKEMWNLFWIWVLTYPIHKLWPYRKTRWGKNVANAVTVLRAIATVPLVYGLHSADPSGRGPWLWALFFVQLTDGVDGTLARELNITSELGSTLDGAVDKLSALLLLITLVIWIGPEFSSFGIIVYRGLMILLLVAEGFSIEFNRDRMALHQALDRTFSSRMPAQIKFMVSMLILGGCWLTSHVTTAAMIFKVGLPVIVCLTVWSTVDYFRDMLDLNWEYATRS